MKPTHRYLFILRPNAAVTTTVEHMREQLHARIGNFSGRRVVPHLTLCFADLTLDEEARVRERMAAGVAGQAAFALHYTGITHFPDRRTIYIDPVEKPAIAELRAPLVAALRADAGIAAALHVTDHPHLTIAAGLKPGQFIIAWEMLALQHFSAADTVDRVVLMRRELKPEALYAVLEEQALQPLP